MGTKNFSNANDLITFSRASGGTALRKIAYGSELVTNGTFDSDLTAWTDASTGSESASVSSGQLVLNRVDSSNSAKVYQAITTNAGGVYAITLDVSDAGLYVMAGTGTSGSSAYNLLIENGIGNALNFRFVATGSTTYITIGPATANGVTGTVDNVSVKEVLFDQGDLTLFNHPAGIPRIEYDADGNVLGLLVEESRTNLVTYSEFTGGWAGKTQITLSPNSVTSPTGNQDGALVTSSGIDPYAFDFISVSSGNDYVFTVWLKGVGNTIGRSPKVWMLNNTATLTSVVADTTPLSSEWRRYTATATCTGTGVLSARIDFDDSGLSGSGEQVQVFGAQFEVGAFPTSYIPTAGATATRSADVASIPVADFGYNQSEGTVVIEASTNSTAVTNHNDINIKDSVGNKVAASGSRTGGSAAGTYSIYSPNTSVLVNVLSVVTEGNTYKAAFTLADNDVSASVDGSAVVSDTTASVTSLTAAVIEIGDGYDYLNGHIKSIKYYPRRLTNAQLVELTS